MNKIKFAVGLLGASVMLLGAAALAQTTTTPTSSTATSTPVPLPPVPLPQHYTMLQGFSTLSATGGLVFQGSAPCNSMPSTSFVACTPVLQTFTVSQDQILVVAENGRIVPLLTQLSQGIKSVMYLKDGQPYMLRVTGEIEKPRVCSQEAKLCPDGSYVSRTGSNCEFTLCPGSTATSTPRQICVTKQEVGDNGQIKSSTDCRTIMPGLRRGSQGEDVRHLQELLQEKGLLQGATTTGFFGSATLNAIQQLQQRLGVPATGFVGPQTLQKLEQGD